MTKTYIVSTGALFALLTVVHIWRMFVEKELATDPAYLGITALSAVLSVWAWRVNTGLSPQSGVGQS